jgi:hypothetical protein
MASSMIRRIITAPQMLYRRSVAALVTHYFYNQASTKYNQPNWSYNYISDRGEMTDRQVSASTMKGR